MKNSPDECFSLGRTDKITALKAKLVLFPPKHDGTISTLKILIGVLK